MVGNEFVWIASIILGLTVLGWLAMDWVESTQQWHAAGEASNTSTTTLAGRSKEQAMDALDLELELMLSYPLDPFAPALLWRPLAQAEWAAEGEAQHTAADRVRNGAEPGLLHPGEVAS